jgi:hypothetical protein
MTEPKGKSGESIGRPSEWREERYQQPGKTSQSFRRRAEPEKTPAPDTVSTPVTRKDYENLEPPRTRSKKRS